MGLTLKNRVSLKMTSTVLLLIIINLTAVRDILIPSWECWEPTDAEELNNIRIIYGTSRNFYGTFRIIYATFWIIYGKLWKIYGTFWITYGTFRIIYGTFQIILGKLWIVSSWEKFSY